MITKAQLSIDFHISEIHYLLEDANKASADGRGASVSDNAIALALKDSLEKQEQGYNVTQVISCVRWLGPGKYFEKSFSKVYLRSGGQQWCFQCEHSEDFIALIDQRRSFESTLSFKRL